MCRRQPRAYEPKTSCTTACFLIAFTFVLGCSDDALNGASDGGEQDDDLGVSVDGSASPLDASDQPAACPKSAPAHMSDCGGYAFSLPVCEYGTDACPRTCTCSQYGFLPSGERDDRWVCPSPVGAACDPAPDCPAVVPQVALSAPIALCAAPLLTFCTYPKAAAGCSATCDCAQTDGVPFWNCRYACPCPAMLPAEGAVCLEQASEQECPYDGTPCTSKCKCDGTTLHGFSWDCGACGESMCPDVAPMKGAVCDSAKIGGSCAYGKTPYCGECACNANVWSCTQSTCDHCPATKPMPGEPCGEIGRYQACPYPSASSPTTTTICMCSGESSANWSCN